jgi:hypothetical protein
LATPWKISKEYGETFSELLIVERPNKSGDPLGAFTTMSLGVLVGSVEIKKSARKSCQLIGNKEKCPASVHI